MTRWKKPYLIPLFIIAAALAFGAVVMLLWNAIVPGLTGWAMLTYPKAIGLLVLCRILFGGFRGGGPPLKYRMMHGMHAKKNWEGLTEEERTKLKDEWSKRCGPPMCG
jgi:hypothetical protein